MHEAEHRVFVLDRSELPAFDDGEMRAVARRQRAFCNGRLDVRDDAVDRAEQELRDVRRVRHQIAKDTLAGK